MNIFDRWYIVVLVFLVIAAGGVFLSTSAPYVKSDDEIVYLIGAKQAAEHSFPDSSMLEGYDYNAYLYPQVMSHWYESLGYYSFKKLVLVIVLVATGVAAYVLFRLLSLSFVSALLLAVVALMPRFTAGTEFWGILTFREAVGRATAVPFFFLGTAVLILALLRKKPIWPVFALFGFCMFLHPATVMVFAFISLIAAGATLLVVNESIVHVLKKILVAGMVFVAAGSYFFVDVVGRLVTSTQSESVSAARYVEAVVFRNTWEFPAASLDWFRHTAIVSAFFLVSLVIFYTFPKLKALRARYKLSSQKILLVFGGTMMIGSVVLTLLLPGANLYFMEHFDAPYIFQQWSRIAKFYYLGLFIVLIPALYSITAWYRESSLRYKKLLVSFLFLGGILSSSFFFEIGQFAIGYPHVTAAYIPQELSKVRDDVTSTEYREVCREMERLGGGISSKVVSSDFSFRYYCSADLYVTQEEGGAYTQLPRKEMVAWYERLLSQRTAFNSGDLEVITTFARSVGADFIILTRNERNKSIEGMDGGVVFLTSRHIIVKVGD